MFLQAETCTAIIKQIVVVYNVCMYIAGLCGFVVGS
jgi:hypothetical protein